MKKRKKLLRLVFGRTTFVVLFLLIQVGILLMGFAWLEEYMLYFYGASVILSAVTLIYIISADESTSIKLSWVVPILVFPVFGTLFYLFVRLQIGTKLIGHRLKMTSAETAPYLKQDTETAERFNEMSSSQGNLVRYMNRFAGCPVYQNTAAQYFPLGDDMFVEMKRRLKAAKHFIFMEYFIVERGEMWNSILEILEEKSLRLKTLTEDVVEASKASTGNISLEMADLNFVELVHQVIGEFEERFQEKNLSMMVHFDQDEAIICADGRRMWRVLENVFGNVAKYAMDNTRVYAEIKVNQPNVTFSLKNISAQPLNISADELTERFIRGDVSRNTEGSGLGLSIAKSLTELQGGEFKLYLDGDLFKVTITFKVKEK